MWKLCYLPSHAFVTLRKRRSKIRDWDCDREVSVKTKRLLSNHIHSLSSAANSHFVSANSRAHVSSASNPFSLPSPLQRQQHAFLNFKPFLVHAKTKYFNTHTKTLIFHCVPCPIPNAPANFLEVSLSRPSDSPLVLPFTAEYDGIGYGGGTVAESREESSGNDRRWEEWEREGEDEDERETQESHHHQDLPWLA